MKLTVLFALFIGVTSAHALEVPSVSKPGEVVSWFLVYDKLCSFELKNIEKKYPNEAEQREALLRLKSDILECLATYTDEENLTLYMRQLAVFNQWLFIRLGYEESVAKGDTATAKIFEADLKKVPTRQQLRKFEIDVDRANASWIVVKRRVLGYFLVKKYGKEPPEYSEDDMATLLKKVQSAK